jgi:hypothetical protein
MVRTAQLADLLRDGVRLDYADPARPQFRVLPEHRARVRALLAPAVRAETQRVLQAIGEYRLALLHIFTLTADGDHDDRAAAGEAVQTEIRLHDDLGPRLASFIRADAVADYTTKTHRCAYCGGAEHAEEGDR